MAKPRRFGGRLAALSSAAILAVYAVGYSVTEQAAQGADAGAAPTNDKPQSGAAAQPVPTSTAAGQRPGFLATATPSAPAGATTYRDGTYVGYATGRHGSLEATVTTAGGRIASVEISQCLTRYPCTRIGALPGQVVKRQSAQVDYVSGATDSSRTFVQAVTNALASAR